MGAHVYQVSGLVDEFESPSLYLAHLSCEHLPALPRLGNGHLLDGPIVQRGPHKRGPSPLEGLLDVVSIEDWQGHRIQPGLGQGCHKLSDGA